MYKSFTLEVTWAAFSQLEGAVDNAHGFSWEIFDTAFWFIWAIFMNIFWVVVFRIAIMAALQSSNITKQIVEPIKQFGDSVWQLAAKAPTYAPVFGGQSMESLRSAWSTLSSSIAWARLLHSSLAFISSSIPPIKNSFTSLFL